ncbi:MAG: 3'(2'),5'-bisphosphate nucleotidase CysQ [Commensalibacter sp.]|nr:3'(2'),5'-bisphosphate nucleotidase CysQ [Commensalibacter sp.]
MSTLSDMDLLDLAGNLANDAAALINTIRARGFTVQKKTDATPVTEADKSSELLILKELRKRTPSIPVVAEEEYSSGYNPIVHSEFWLVDPLDGTREFARGSDNFTVNIGLIRNHKPVLGAVVLPAYQQLYLGIVGQGAWRIDKQGKEAIHVAPPPTKGWRVMGSHHYATDPNLQAFLKHFPIMSVKNIGSAVKIVRIAEGSADLHPRFNRTMEWDTAAPQAILEAAGGTLCTLDGQVLSYGKAGWENPSFVCASHPINDYLDKITL